MEEKTTVKRMYSHFELGTSIRAAYEQLPISNFQNLYY